MLAIEEELDWLNDLKSKSRRIVHDALETKKTLGLLIGCVGATPHPARREHLADI